MSTAVQIILLAVVVVGLLVLACICLAVGVSHSRRNVFAEPVARRFRTAPRHAAPAAPFRAEPPAVAAGTVPVTPTRSQPPSAAFPPLNRPSGETRPAPRRRPVLPASRWAPLEGTVVPRPRPVFEPTDFTVRQRRHLDLMLRIAASCEPHGADVDAMFDGITANAFAPLAALTAGGS